MRLFSTFSPFSRVLSETVDPTHVAVFRIAYAVVAFSIPLTVNRFGNLSYYGLPEAEVTAYIFANFVWMVALVLIACGRFVSIAAIYCCLVTPILFDNTIGSQLARIGAFWLIFLDTRPLPAWPLYGLAFNVAILDCFSGLAKLYDPFWVHGTGFYYTLLEPWLRDDVFSSWMLDQEWLMLFLNYGAIVVQIIGLPLLLFRATRFHAILSIAAQFVLLTYPIRIDPIGPIGLALCIGMLAIVPDTYPSRLFRKAAISNLGADVLESSTAMSRIGAAIPDIGRAGWLGWGGSGRVLAYTAFGLMIYSTGYHLVLGLDKRYTGYPVVQPPLKVVAGNTSIKPESGFSIYSNILSAPVMVVRSIGAADLIRFLPSAFRKSMQHINRRTVGIGWWAPFTMKHFLGRYGYYVHFFDEQGQPIEPLIVNHADGRRGAYESGFLRNSVLQNRTWVVTQIAHKIAENPKYRLSNSEDRIVRAIFHFLLAKATQAERDRIIRAVLFALPYNKPAEFAGRPRAENSALALLTYDVLEKDLKVTAVPSHFAFTLRFTEFGSLPPVVGYW